MSAPTAHPPDTGPASKRFVWPPRPGADRSAATTREPPRGILVPLAPPGRSCWSAFEETWLDVTSPPLGRRLAELDWSPDDVGDYCRRCGTTSGPFMTDPTGCPACRENRLPWSRLVRLGEYTHPLRTLIHEVKFTHWRRLGRDLGRLLGRSVAAHIEEARVDSARWRPLPEGPPIIVPVPMSLPRRLVRGIDHTHEIAAGVAEATGGRLVHALRRDHGPSQLSIPQSRRAANVARSIHPRKKASRDLVRSLVVIVDDVTTTGATLRAACRGVQAVSRMSRSPARPVIWTAVLAKTPLAGGGRRWMTSS